MRQYISSGGKGGAGVVRLAVSALSEKHTAIGANHTATHFTYTLPAGTMGANDILKVEALWTLPAANTGNSSILAALDGATFRSENCTGTTRCSEWRTLLANRNDVAVQTGLPAAADGLLTATTAAVVLTKDTTTDLDITFESTIVVDTEEVTLEYYAISLIKSK